MMKIQEKSLVVLLVFVALVHSSSGSDSPVDCHDIHRQDNSKPSGVYTIYPGGPISPLNVYCDMDTDGGRWTVFLKRTDGSQNFFRSWSSYKTGFGDVVGEYWLGLENLFLLTNWKQNELWVDMEDWDGASAFARYSLFKIGSEKSGYQLNLGAFSSGSAGDSLSNLNGMKFSTFDKDQDAWDKHCAQRFLGAFWYNKCYEAHPTGIYAVPEQIGIRNVTVVWKSWKGWNVPVKTMAMKIRPIGS